MTEWHYVLYIGAAALGLRALLQAMTSYRSEFERRLVVDELEKIRKERDEQQPADAEATQEGQRNAA